VFVTGKCRLYIILYLFYPAFAKFFNTLIFWSINKLVQASTIDISSRSVWISMMFDWFDWLLQNRKAYYKRIVEGFCWCKFEAKIIYFLRHDAGAAACCEKCIFCIAYYTLKKNRTWKEIANPSWNGGLK
jgi:hypothetical protein